MSFIQDARKKVNMYKRQSKKGKEAENLQFSRDFLTFTENDLASFKFDSFDAEVLEPDIHETDSMNPW